MSVLKFPEPANEKPIKTGAGRLLIWRSRFKEWFYRLLNRVGAPGAIQEAAIDDPLTGQNIRVHVGLFFTRVSVNGRDYYFHRLTGKFDGTGSGCR